MKPSSRRIAFFVAYITIAGGLWTASNWWERGWATRLATDSVSPDGCYRVQSFKPYWVLPDTFHRRSEPNEDQPAEWFPWWGYPGFYRLFDNRSGELISETNIYDLESAGGGLSWGEGSGYVMAGLIIIASNLPDCTGDNPGKTRRKP
ncbi:hypothetical protein [Pseudomonas helleri]|uniref:hypothetical protein n=1 Tax=Pseudomonas helleri TaxID=1608996 RepID=UPI003FD03E4E